MVWLLLPKIQVNATVQIDDVKLRDALNRLAALGLDTGRVLRVESRRILESIIRQAPPSDQALGKGAVKTDLRRVFMPVEGSIIRKARKTSQGGFQILWATSTGQVFASRPEHFKPDAGPSELAALHQQHRGANGRVSGMGARVKKQGNQLNVFNRYVVPRAAFNRYQREKLANVGKLRAGFGHAAQQVGAMLPSWVRRNLTPDTGYVHDNLKTGDSPSLTAGNTAPGSSTRLRSIVNRAVNARVKAIATNVARMIKHGAGKSGDYGYAKD